MEETTKDVIIERLDNFIKVNAEQHQSILEQTTKTNGSVAGIQKWRYLITGALIISQIIIVPIIIAIILKLM